MQVIALAFLKKAAPYLVVFFVGFVGGIYLERQISSGAITAAKFALSQQQIADVNLTASENAAVATELAKASVDANAAESALLAANKQAGAKEASLASQIAAQAMQSGQDAPDAPVLAHTLDVLGASK